MKILGLDLGISSVGSAMVDYNKEIIADTKILHTNIRKFDAPVTSKEKTSLHKIRGEKVRDRNSNENYHSRRKKIINFLIKYKLITVNDVKNISVNLPKSKKKKEFANKVARFLYETEIGANDVLSLRYKALSEKLTNIELARLLYSMNNHRGVSYEDSRSSKNISEKKLKELKSKDINSCADGSSDKLLYGLINFKEAFDNTKYKTVGEFLYKEHRGKFRNTPKRNGKSKQSDFKFVIPRKNIVDELNTIFNTQIELSNSLIDENFINEYIECFNWEKESPSYKDLVSFCDFKQEVKAASKYKAESLLYIYLEKFYNLSYKEKDDKRYKTLDIDNINKLISELNTNTITYKQVKDAMEKKLNFVNVMFKGIDDYSKTFMELKEFKAISNALNVNTNILELFKNTDEKSLYNNVIETLAYSSSVRKKEEDLYSYGITNEDTIDKLLEIKVKGNLSYCEEVLEQICNGMLSGLIPHYAKEEVQKAYSLKRIIKGHYLPPVNETDLPIKNNHTVVRALSQMRLVVNETLKNYREKYNNPNWFFDRVIIETSREFLSKEQSNKYDKISKENEKAKKEAVAFCEKYGKLYPSKDEILKARLYIQQEGQELYPCVDKDDSNYGKFTIIEAENLFEEGYCEIDHTLPLSRSLDDSFNNKTLVLSKTNQNKGNQTPFEYLSSEMFSIMEDKLKTNIKKLGYKKVSNLTNRDFKELDGFTSRDLNDTRMITKYAGLYINNYLAFSNSNEIKRRVFANNGKITSLLRKTWGIGAKNRNNHLHHGEDAILIALSDNSLIKHISTYYGIQTQLEGFNFNRTSFDILFNNNTTIKDYIIANLKEDGVDIDNIEKSKFSKREISSKIFRIIANKSLPNDNFLKDFKEAINNAIITHKEKIKINGQIHADTISKIDNKTKDDAVLVRGGCSTNGDAIRYDVFKNSKGKFEFIKITSKYYGLSLDKLPQPKDSSSLFMFSIYPKSLLNIVFEDNKILKELKGLFRKIDGSLYIDSIKNLEDVLFRYKLDTLKISYFGSDDIVPFEKDTEKEIQKLMKFEKFEKKISIDTSLLSIKRSIENIKNYISKEFPSCAVRFVFGNTTCIETTTIKNKLILENIIQDRVEDNLPNGTLVFRIDENKLISPYFVLASSKIKSFKKVKTDTFGNETFIEKEKRTALVPFKF